MGKRSNPFKIIPAIPRTRIVGMRAMAQIIPGCRGCSDISDTQVSADGKMDMEIEIR